MAAPKPADAARVQAARRFHVLLVSHAHWGHLAHAVELARRYDTPIRATGGLNQALATLGVLPPRLLPA